MAQPAATAPRAGRTALVLSGGGSRGAYQAGVIAALAAAHGLSDGQPLPYDVVCGTSIGALNGYLIATAQYTRLRDIWYTLPSRNVSVIRAPFNKIPDQEAGVGTRLVAALKLGRGFTTDLQGLLDARGVWDALAANVNPADPVHLPLYVATTNLTRGSAEIFKRSATTTPGVAKQRVDDALLAGYDVHVVRDATDANLRQALFASAAIPLAFPPVMIEPATGGAAEAFVDGGVTENVPISIARRCCDTLNVLMVDPPTPDVEFNSKNMLEIAFNTFQTMQRAMLEYQVRFAYAEHDLPLRSVSLIRPAKPLPGTFVEFSNSEHLLEAWQTGYEDGSKGWQPFDPSQFTD